MKILWSLVLTLFFSVSSRADPLVAKVTTVPFELLRSKHMAVSVKINGKGPYRVIFDTGAPITLLNNKVARESGMLAKDAAAPLFSFFGSMGPATIKTLQVGDLKANDVAAVVMDHPTLATISRVLGPVEGLVGFPFFARFKMTIDYQAKQMTFAPSSFVPPDALETMSEALMGFGQTRAASVIVAPPGIWGFSLEKVKGDEEAGVTVKEVFADGAAAAAGVKPGDRLLTLDGRWTDSVVEAYQAASHVKPGVLARVQVKRGTKEMELVVKPRAGL